MKLTCFCVFLFICARFCGKIIRKTISERKERLQTVSSDYFAAADIGTTSVVTALTDGDGTEIFRKTFYNPGRRFGADVISRISYTVKHPEAAGSIGALMRGSVEKALTAGCEEHGVPIEKVRMISVVGNPAMELLFGGISPEPLGMYPYRLPDGFGRYEGSIAGIPVHMGKLLSGFIGADALIGAAYLVYGRKSAAPLIGADLGTNCECFCHDGNKTVFASAAAGPAFEGGHIECGMGALPGAVSGVTRGDAGPVLTVIGGGAARGFCGSGIISAAAYMLGTGVIDGTGRMNPDAPGVYRGENGLCFGFGSGLYITQKDIRQIQTAKAAVAAGIEMISGHIGSGCADIVLTGAFGDSTDCAAAGIIGLIPRGKSFAAVGNAALEGALLFARSEEFRHFSERISGNSVCPDISAEDVFQERFINNMNFQ